MALTFAEVSTHYRLAGSVFQWTKYFSRSKAYAWFTGWIYLFAGVLTTAGVLATMPLVLTPFLDRLGIGIQLSDSLGTQQSIALITIAIYTLLNAVGVKVVALINNSAVVFEALGLLVFAVILASLRLDLLAFGRRRQIRAPTLIGLHATHVPAQRLGRHAEITRDVRDRPAAVDHHAGAAIKQLGRVLPRTGHGRGASPLPRTESSDRGLRQTRPGSTAFLSRQRLVYGQPALYTATREGSAWAGMPQLEPARVGVATSRHWALCARLAVQLERAERCEAWGEPRVRAAELDAGEATPRRSGTAAICG